MCLCSPQQVGVIVRLEKESLQILSMHGKVQTMKHTAVTKRRENRFATALDSESNSIQRNDIVKVVDGAHSVRIHAIHTTSQCELLRLRETVAHMSVIAGPTRSDQTHLPSVRLPPLAHDDGERRHVRVEDAPPAACWRSQVERTRSHRH